MLGQTKPVDTVPTDPDGRLTTAQPMTTDAGGAPDPAALQLADQLDDALHALARTAPRDSDDLLAKVDQTVATLADTLDRAQATAIHTALTGHHTLHGEMTECGCGSTTTTVRINGDTVTVDRFRFLRAAAAHITAKHCDQDPATAPHHALLRQQAVWRTRDGRIVQIADMTTSHLVNIRRWMVRQAPRLRAAHIAACNAWFVQLLCRPASLYDDERWAAARDHEMADDAFQFGPDDPEQWIATQPLYIAISDQLDRRGGLSRRNRATTAMNNRVHRLRR